MATLTEVKKALRAQVETERAKNSALFFKTGKGEYGAGDKFLGIRVPKQRAIAKTYKDLALPEVIKLLHSPWHEERLTALFILVLKFQKGDALAQQKIYKLYLANTNYVNNWDLVDSSASYIVGAYLLERDRSVLYKLANSKNLWEKRIAIIATLYFIKHGQLQDTLKISKLLLHDSHDLIHKAVGWMLREVGNQDVRTEEKFLNKHAHEMPRTMLRYAIEKFPPTKRTMYMKARNS